MRVFNPDAEADGYRTAGTIVQLVTDDMPYLVESVTAELSRSGLQVHRVVHPIVVVSRDVAGGLRDILPDAEADDPPSDALAESAGRQRALVADASHQLRNPMAALRLRSGTARDERAGRPARTVDRRRAAAAGRSTALQIISSLRMTATRATSFFLPRAISVS